LPFKKDKADVSAISVQLNLTMLHEAAIDELAPKMWLYVNSQDKVNTADFSANHPSELFHGRDLGGSSGETQSRD
jgi:hypothetical protein